MGGDGSTSLLTEAFSISDDNKLWTLSLDDTVTQIVQTPISAGVAPTSTWAGEWSHYVFADINGDGLADAIGGTPSYLNTGAGFTEAGSLTGGTLADLNEDGITAMSSPDSTNGPFGDIPHTAFAYISDRMGSQKPYVLVQDTNGDNIHGIALYSADVDGDGRLEP